MADLIHSYSGWIEQGQFNDPCTRQVSNQGLGNPHLPSTVGVKLSLRVKGRIANIGPPRRQLMIGTFGQVHACWGYGDMLSREASEHVAGLTVCEGQQSARAVLQERTTSKH